MSDRIANLIVWVVGVAICALLGGVVTMNFVGNLHDLGFLHRTLGYWDSVGVTFSLVILYYIISFPTRLGTDD
jgi:hypothetical protein